MTFDGLAQHGHGLLCILKQLCYWKPSYGKLIQSSQPKQKRTKVIKKDITKEDFSVVCGLEEGQKLQQKTIL